MRCIRSITNYWNRLLDSLLLTFGIATTALAAPPPVAVDIAPLHSLVSQVMKNLGETHLLIPAEASPHQHMLRPSEAKALAQAEVVFWISANLTPQLGRALDNLASAAETVEMLEMEPTLVHRFRENAAFEAHRHHKHEHHEHTHDDANKDPHAWLDPENAKIWVNIIGDVLSKHDPDNASVYRSNAKRAENALNQLITTTQTKLDALNRPKFIVFHDAYQYFEKRFNIPASGAISISDALDPSPARVRKIQERVKQLGVTCVFGEPQYNAGLIKNVFQGSDIKTIGIMDPLGVNIPIGPDHYQQLIEAMVNSLSQCQ